MPILRFRKPKRDDSYVPEYEEYDEYGEDEYYEEYGEQEDPYEDYDGYEDSEEIFETAPSPDKKDHYTAKIRRYRRAKAMRTIAVVVILVMIALIVLYRIDTKVFTEASAENVAQIVRPSSAEYRSLNGSIFVYSRDGAHCMDTDGKPRWNITYEMQQPIVDISGDKAVIADYNGSTLYVVSAEKQLSTIRTGMPVRAVSVAENGEVAAVLSDAAVTWVYLYSSSGEEVAYFKMTMNQTGYPVSVSISPNGEMVCISHLRAEESDVRSSVAFYNFGAVGQNEVDNYVSGFDYKDEIVAFTRFLNDQTSFAVSDSRIAFFQGREIPQSGENMFFSENCQAVYCSNKYAALLFPDTSGDYGYRLDVYDSKGTRISSIHFSMEFTGIQIAYDRIYIYDEQSCMIYNTDGTRKFDGALGKSIDALIPGQRIDRFTVITSDGLDRISLR